MYSIANLLQYKIANKNHRYTSESIKSMTQQQHKKLIQYFQKNKRSKYFYFYASCVLLVLSLIILFLNSSYNSFLIELDDRVSNSSEHITLNDNHLVPIANISSTTSKYDIYDNSIISNLKSFSHARQHSTQEKIVDNATPLDIYKTYCSEQIESAIPVIMEFKNISLTRKYSRADYVLAMNQISSGVLSMLANKNWTIHITNKNISACFPIAETFSDISYIGGICWIPTKEIWININTEPDIIIHEIGHAVDWEFGGLSLSTDWTNAISEAKQNISKYNSLVDSWNATLFGKISEPYYSERICERDRFFEQYATAFNIYWCQPKQLLVEAPSIYEYFAKHFGSAIREQADIDEAYAMHEQRISNPVSINVRDRQLTFEEWCRYDNTADTYENDIDKRIAYHSIMMRYLQSNIEQQTNNSNNNRQQKLTANYASIINDIAYLSEVQRDADDVL